MNICIYALTGERITVTVDSPNFVTALSIKKQIQKQTGVNLKNQTLCVNGCLWDESVTYAQLKINNPELPDELEQSRILIYIKNANTIIPDNLRFLVHMEYKDLKDHSKELALAISKITRSARFTLKDFPDTERYWNSINMSQRCNILEKNDISELINSTNENNSCLIL